MRLDEADPVAAWRERAAELAARARALTGLGLTEVRYRSAGTDLTVGLVPDTRWTGGGGEDPDGLAYMPNIPTEEVFTSPDRRRAEGTISLTKPVIIRGQVVEGLKVTFSGERITDVTATSGAAAVRAELDTDEGARSLGEVSLVDRGLADRKGRHPLPQHAVRRERGLPRVSSVTGHPGPALVLAAGRSRITLLARANPHFGCPVPP